MSATAMHATGSKENSMAATTMKAITLHRYGSPDVLELQEVDTPTVEPDGVLVRVRAASVNPVDYHAIHGGLLIRLTSGFRRPRTSIPGVDVAGIVEAVGENVTALQPGDEVFGTCAGSLAEYAPGGKNLVPKPANLTFEQAAAIPIAGITALQGLRDKAHIQPGQTVLINGAAGGVGTFAVQLARALGAHVTGVCSTGNVELVRSLGADQVVDYTHEDFARRGQQYDVVFDLVGNRSLSDLRRVTKPEGTLILSGGGHHRGHGRAMLKALRTIASGALLARFAKQRIVFYIAQIKPEDLLTLKELIEARKVTPIIDRTYPLSETSEAMRYLATGHARAKVVVTL